MRPDKPLTAFEFSLYRNYRIVHGVRIALAFILTFLLVRVMAIPEGSWPLITLVVVMGPISSWGNVFPRAVQRIGGTIFGSISGLIALKLELISLPVMLIWCAAVMFISGFLTLGKHPYMALLIGITLAVICGGVPGDMTTALWRGGDVILGSLLALLFTSIYSQKAYTHWRIQLSDLLLETARVYHAGFSPNLVEKPRLTRPLQRLLSNVIKMRALIEPSSKETRTPRSVFEGIQTLNRNLVCTLELQLNAWWASRQSHLIMLNAPALRRTQQMTENTLRALSRVIVEGDTGKMAANSEELAEITRELRQLIAESDSDELVETPIHGYVWLSLEMASQLERLTELIRLTLRK
ncbi:MAG TPA: FUSC family protein [Erwinia persicina]|uniref:FUSC family protein n=1 Tax=Erwinia persicina TaxID=55211 RepID=A0A4U3F746_9GAMM|nr:FUSC family protein [Erwinia persicina]MBC3946970.1 FUSC family protein [Erwinia persicina]MBD8105549.1 FUSC family protein [Erwinia persicina]MBD8163436.1 FUSC family protein [Erwinia persicina]MBD8167352.1 FUSC family protein [Erwinia persicina]MBD8209685.1 FUSC family protein [Erwinia persicina]